ncbi:protein of unknown function [Acetoanaerobium sticklandii]|uniref:Uncharacterized protein n=1 Tax=Acetoanaerobium sticklandii (strain ATCC 12662 / DSM 519 / JCM 1433 / CCUG 9281 / NCIMB 10654 / HF) TaxID=499177 RepID=E3PWA9_ACESD|nr:hypothetical protein [Acetoanaerobium sticklandii]CBH20724.1 protein of unknown function [Acetoanaerobium sticklandii]
MNYISIEKPSPYDNVISFDIFRYSDEVTLETQLFSLDVIKVNPLEQFKDKIKPSYRVLVYDLHVEKQNIDFNEITKIVNQECFEIESMDMFISITI